MLQTSFVLNFGFDPGSWHRAPKSLGVSWVIVVSFVLLKCLLVGTWMASGWGLVTRKTKPWLETGTFSPTLHPLREAGNWVNNGSCIHNEAPIKIPKLQGGENFPAVHSHFMGIDAAALETLSGVSFYPNSKIWHKFCTVVPERCKQRFLANS